MAEDVKERLLRYLNDAYAVEDSGLSELKDLANETTNSDARTVITDHIPVTQSQIDRLTARITALGGQTSGGKSFINTFLGKASNVLNIFHDKEDKQTQDMIKAYSFENFEVGMYTSLKAYADSVGDYETAQLADTIIGEEQLAAERMLRVVPMLATTATAATSPTTP